MKMVITTEPKKACACGCGKLINNRTPEGRIINFRHGHRKLTQEESDHRRKVFNRISADPEYQKRRISGQYIKPNKVERRLMNIIEKYDLPFKYVGDGFHIIEKSCPDFISTDGSKRVIEIFGDYWHTIKGRTEMSGEEI